MIKVYFKNDTIEFSPTYVPIVTEDGREGLIELKSFQLPHGIPCRTSEDKVFIAGEDPRIKKLKEFIEYVK